MQQRNKAKSPKEDASGLSAIPRFVIALETRWKRNPWIKAGTIVIGVVIAVFAFFKDARDYVLCGGQPASTEALITLAEKGLGSELAGVACPDLRSVKVPGGGSLLFVAAQAGNVDALRQLIAQGLDPDASAFFDGVAGATPLLVAIKNRKTKAAIALFQVTTDPFKADAAGDTSLTWAIKNDDAEALRVLLTSTQARKAVAAKPPLIVAATEGRPAAVRALLANGFDVDAPDAQGRTALHAAAESGHVSIMEMLLKQKPNIRLRDVKGRTAEEVASNSAAREEIAAYRSALTTEAFLYASANKVDELAKVFAKGADLNSKMRDKTTIFHVAAHGLAPNAVKWLGDQKIDSNVNTVDDGSNTPLMRAVSITNVCVNNPEGLAQTIRALVAAGANPTHVVPHQGSSPLHSVVTRCPTSVVEAMLDGAPINTEYRKDVLLDAFFDAIAGYPYTERTIAMMLRRYPELVERRNAGRMNVFDIVNRRFSTDEARKQQLLSILSRI